MSAALNITHPWERGGHLKAPFRVVKFSVEVYQACEGAPRQPGGTCYICGTAIMNVFRVRDANGFEFVVGCDCVQKVDAELHSECKTLLKNHKRDVKLAEFRKARLAREASERAANLAAGNGEFTNAELRKKAHEARVAQWEKEKAERAAAREAERLASKHVGEIKKRITVSLTCTFTYDCEPGPYGTTTIYGFQDADKNAFIVKTTSGLGFRRPIEECSGVGADGKAWARGSYQGVGRGDKVTLKGTIMSHDEYKGCKQTHLGRCKVLAIAAGEES